MNSSLPAAIRSNEVGKSFLRRLIFSQTIGIAVVIIMVMIGSIFDRRLMALLPLGIVVVIVGLISYGILLRGHITTSGYVFFLGTSFLFTVAIYIRGYQDVSTIFYLWPILAAMSILDTRGGVIVLGMSILSYLIVALGQFLGYFHPILPFDPLRGALLTMGSVVVIFCLLAYSAWLSGQNASRALFQAQEITGELKQLNETLENQVMEHTKSLEQRNSILQTVAGLARLASQARDEDMLLDQTVQILAQQVRLDHVNIFLLDDLGDTAILRASNSEEGKALIARQLQLDVSRGELAYLFPETDILRYHVGGQDYRIPKPIPLQDVKANLSFSIATAKRFLGILNIQTIDSIPDPADQETLRVFADQIALSIDNLRLLSQLQNRLSEINLLAGQNVHNAWERIRGGGTLGFQYDRIQVIPADESLGDEITDQLRSGHSVSYMLNGQIPQARLVAPIILREDIIGVIGYEDNDPNHEWQEDEKALLETIASRVSLALENTRLVAEAEDRAERERMIGQITVRMRETLDIDLILQTAIQEMRQRLAFNLVEVRLQPTMEKMRESKKD